VFLEYSDEIVTVNDMLHTKTADGWQFEVGSYNKLRLSADGLVATLKVADLLIETVQQESGFVVIAAHKPA